MDNNMNGQSNYTNQNSLNNNYAEPNNYGVPAGYTPEMEKFFAKQQKKMAKLEKKMNAISGGSVPTPYEMSLMKKNKLLRIICIVLAVTTVLGAVGTGFFYREMDWAYGVMMYERYEKDWLHSWLNGQGLYGAYYYDYSTYYYFEDVPYRGYHAHYEYPTY